MEGKLKHWNEDKGFGFIASEQAEDIFIHISALKKMNRRPRIGDTITFQVHIDNNGKKRATNASIHGVAEITRKSHKKPELKNSSNSLIASISLIILIALGYGAYQRYSTPNIIINNERNHSSNSVVTDNAKRTKPMSNSKYKCSGKQHCSQMISCEEAKFYLQNCPNTKMDGNNDGIPCERQWCK